MSEAETRTALSAKVARANEEHEQDSKTLFGFWVYLMTDCVLFASLLTILFYLSMTGRSFTEEKHQVWYFFTQTWWLIQTLLW